MKRERLSSAKRRGDHLVAVKRLVQEFFWTRFACIRADLREKPAQNQRRLTSLTGCTDGQASKKGGQQRE